MINKLFAVTICASLFATHVFADSDICDSSFVETVKMNEALHETNICRGFATTFSSAEPISTVIVGDEEIVGVNVLSTRTIGVIALKPGKTNIHLIGEDGTVLFLSNIQVQVPKVTAQQTPPAVTNIQIPTESPPAVEMPKPASTTATTRIVVNAGDAEILYDCVENCTKLKR